jgi:uncharacterized protein (DUF362 family)
VVSGEGLVSYVPDVAILSLGIESQETTVAQACLDAGASRIMVMDNSLNNPELCMSASGIRKACQGIKSVYVLAPKDEKFYQEVRVPKGKVLDRVAVLKEVLESQVLISLPVTKSHSATGISMGLKGLMGLIWERGGFHSQLLCSD